MTIIPTAVRLTATTAQTGLSAEYLSARVPGSTATTGRDFIAGLVSMAADSTAEVITDVDTTDVAFTGGLDSLTTTVALKGARDSSTAASEIEASASVSTVMTSGVAIGTFTAIGIFAEAPANSTAVVEATAGDTGSFPEFSI